MADTNRAENLTLETSAERIEDSEQPVADLPEDQSSLVAFVAHRDRIVVNGPDAAKYLQGQLSQQVEGMDAGATSRSLLLQPQGKVDSWIRIHRVSDEEFWLDIDSGFGSATMARLERFKLRTAAEFTLDTVSALSVRGPGAAASVGELPADAAMLDATWGGVEGCDVIFGGSAEGGVEAFAATNSLALAPAEFGEILRVWQGIPAMGAELDESTIPAAAGVVEVSVDFTKGCYVGQELVARVDSRGNNTPTNLHRLVAPAGSEIGVGAELFDPESGGSGGVSLGGVTSASVWPADRTVVALGYLKRSVVPGSELVTYDGTPIQVRP